MDFKRSKISNEEFENYLNIENYYLACVNYSKNTLILDGEKYHTSYYGFEFGWDYGLGLSWTFLKDIDYIHENIYHHWVKEIGFLIESFSNQLSHNHEIISDENEVLYYIGLIGIAAEKLRNIDDRSQCNNCWQYSDCKHSPLKKISWPASGCIQWNPVKTSTEGDMGKL